VTLTHLAFYFRSYLIERRIANSTSCGGLADTENPLLLPEICKEMEILQCSSGCDGRTGMFGVDSVLCYQAWKNGMTMHHSGP
jgi:hypothetical protein